MEGSEDAVPFLDDTWKYGDMLIKTLRTHSERVKINEGASQKDFTVVYLQSSLTNCFFFSFFFHYHSNKNLRDSN